MVLTNAERQRRWREKQKAIDKDKYLEQERSRKRPYYVPVERLNKKELSARRKSTNKRVRRHYEIKKRANPETVEIYNSDAGPSKSTRRSDTSTPLVVKFPSYKNKGQHIRKRYKSSLRNAYRKIDELEQENEELQRSKKRVQKRLERERLEQRKGRSSSSDDADVSANLDSDIDDIENRNTNCKSPRKSTTSLLRRLKLSCKGRALLKKRLFFAECLNRDMQTAIKSSYKKVLSKLPFYLIKKYRFIAHLERETGITIPKERKVKESKITKRHNSIKNDIITFLKREDNSTVIVSKKESNFVKEGEKEEQKRVLSDYIHNLHQKYRLENPEKKFQDPQFYSMRSKYLMLANFASRRTCLCSRHQNMALKMKAMRSVGITCSKNPDVFVKEQDTNQKLKTTLETDIKDPTVKYTQWKKVNDGSKLRWKEIEELVSKTEFIDIMEKQTSDFRSHINRVKIQYAEMKNLRENLPKNDIMLWMDFAENFTCTSVEAVQSSYWNQPMVSLHTMIAYFPEHFNKKLQSYVAVSDSLAHNATSVFTILKKIVPTIKEEFVYLKTIHFLTDSPTSQYRNKTIFKILADMKTDFDGITGRWNYLESGHGKGPCDGLGASVKRSADMAIKQGKCLIQGADDFFAWAKQNEEQGSKIKYVFYNQEDIDNASEILNKKETPVPIPGTFQLHAVVPISKSVIMTRDVSCYCNECTSGNRVLLGLHGWKTHKLCISDDDQDEEINGSNEQATETSNEQIVNEQTEQGNTFTLNPIVYEGKWVSVVYESKWFLGNVVDEDENEIEVNFLEECGKYKNAFRWPSTKDQIWIEKTNILTVLETDPIAAGKTQRMFKITPTDEENITQIFTRIKK